MNRYLFIVEPTVTGYSAYSPDLPGCIATGATCAETRSAMHDAVEFHIEGLRQASLPVPEPTCEAAYCEVAA